MDSEILSIPTIMLITYWLTERLAEWLPEGRVRKLLAFVPVVLAVVLASTLRLAFTGTMSWAELGRAVVAGLVLVLLHNVRKAGEKPRSELSGNSGELEPQ